MDPNWTRLHGTRRERILKALASGASTSEELRARFGDGARVALSRLCREGLVLYDKNDQTFRLAAVPAQGLTHA